MLKANEILRSNKVEYKLTILILSLANRLDTLSKLYKSLQKQIINHSVQIIYLGDNKSMSVGEKRNAAMKLVNGRYFCFIDDDDGVSPDYVQQIFNQMDGDPEVITFNYIKTTNGNDERLHKYFYQNTRAIYLAPNREYYKVLPNHLCVWRKDVVTVDFPNKSLKEDHEWAELMDGKYDKVHNIDKVLYYYNYSKLNSETH